MSNDWTDRDAMEYSLRYNPPIDRVAAEHILKEVKRLLGYQGVVFILQSGSCLGVVRDNAFIPWDDDMDIVSVMGMNGLTEEKIYAVIEAFKRNGYHCKRNYSILDKPPYGISHSVIKHNTRLDWSCLLVVDGVIISYPGVRIPARGFTHPKEIEFLGENFFVPDPPEEYLRLKYGPEWMKPRKAGEYERDVLEQIPPKELTGGACFLRVFDQEGEPVARAEVVLAGGGRSLTDEDGYAKIVLPVTAGINYYALIIRYTGHEQVLYEEEMEPNNCYVYREDSYSAKADGALGAFGTLGGVLSAE